MAEIARLTGPVTGGSHGWPFAASLSDLAELGYTEEEYFIEGSAATYAPAAGVSLGADGRWAVERRASVEFRTRVLVRRPTDPERFNGTVVVDWTNVSAGFDVVGGDGPTMYEEGFAFGGVSAQAVGVHGYSAFPQGLVAWDPERYGRLSIPIDDISYDIFTQAARLFGPSRPLAPLDPLNGLRVERLIASGGSQSAHRLHTYVNAVHPLDRVFDAFLISLHSGMPAPLKSPSGLPRSLDDRLVPEDAPLSGQIRGDLDEPIFIVNSESEVLSFLPVRRSDDDRFRLWEIAGASHMGDAISALTPLFARDFGGDITAVSDATTATDANTVDWQPVVHAALHHLQSWLTAGVRPPSMPWVEVDGAPPELQLDEHGNARGGVRLPEVDAPIATLSGTNDGPGFQTLLGRRTPFPPDKLRSLYPDHATYVSAYAAAAQRAVDAGTLRPQDVRRMVEQTDAAPLLPSGRRSW
jgi:hypothetical protein